MLAPVPHQPEGAFYTPLIGKTSLPFFSCNVSRHVFPLKTSLPYFSCNVSKHVSYTSRFFSMSFNIHIQNLKALIPRSHGLQMSRCCRCVHSTHQQVDQPSICEMCVQYMSYLQLVYTLQINLSSMLPHYRQNIETVQVCVACTGPALKLAFPGTKKSCDRSFGR